LKKISLNTESIELTSPLTPTPISAISEDSKLKSANIPDDDKDMAVSPSDKDTKEDTKPKKTDSDNEESKDKMDEDDNEKSVDKNTNEDSKMTDHSGEDDDQDLKIDDAMDEVQY